MNAVHLAVSKVLVWNPKSKINFEQFLVLKIFESNLIVDAKRFMRILLAIQDLV